MLARIVKENEIINSELKYVVICVRHENRWLLVRHRERTTWEFPGGHIEENETPEEAAARELYEEAGVIAKSLNPVADYYAEDNEGHAIGRVFYCIPEQFVELPDFEIAERKMFDEFPEHSTYPSIYKLLIKAFIQYEKTHKISTARAYNYTAGDLIDHHGIGAIIRNELDEILMFKHVKFKFWTIPVGKTDEKETVVESLLKEVKEETNISVEAYREIGEETKYYFREGREVKVTTHLFDVESWSDEPINAEPHKHTDMTWMPVSKILSIEKNELSNMTMKMLDYMNVSFNE